MAVSTIVFGRSSYENVVCLGLVVDEDGRKMSKHLGNVLEPLPLMEAHGADALRWFFAASGSPWSTRRIGAGTLEEIVRKVLLTYWNTVSFLALYANAAAAEGNAWGPDRPPRRRPPADRPLLDRWMLSELHDLAGRHRALEGFDTAGADGASPASSTTCPTGTCAGRGGGSGKARTPEGRRRSPRCTNAWRCSPG